jgi:ParB family chromosome partitioning protein
MKKTAPAAATAAATTEDTAQGAPTPAQRATMPLNAIVAWPHNPRKTRDDKKVAQTSANLLKQGQIMPLIVVSTGKGDMAYAIDGETRRLSMNANVDAGHSEPDMPVDVLVLDENTPLATLMAIALAANTIRTEMNPIEEMEAYRAMRDAGMSDREVGEIYNLSDRQVAQRISLGNLVGGARDLVRSGQRQLRWAEAMTLGSPTQQERVVSEIAANPASYPDSHSVKADFTRNHIPVESALFDPKLLESCLVTDLFSHGSGGSFSDPAAFWALQGPELDKIADELKKTHGTVRKYYRERFNDAGWTSGGDPETSEAIVIAHEDGSHEVRTGMIPPAHETGAPSSQEGSFLSQVDDLDDDLQMPDEKPVARIETNPLDAATRETTAYLSAQVIGGLKVQVASDARKAMAFVIASTLTRNGGLASSMQINGIGIDTRAQTSECFVALASLRERRNLIAKEAGILGVTSPAKVVQLLLDMPEDKMQELFAWTVSESVMTPLQPSTFDLCDAIGVEPMPGWSIESAYLETLTSAQTRALAGEVVPASDQPSRNVSVQQVRKAITTAVENDVLQGSWIGDQPTWLPPQIAKARAEASARADATAQAAQNAANAGKGLAAAA